MSNSLGALIVRLGLDAGEFQRGLTKQEYNAQQFARNVNGAMLQVAKVLGSLKIGEEVFARTKDIIEQAGALNDLADATGSTVENISRLSNQSKIAGTDFATLQNAVLKLSAGMSGTDEETSKAKDALRALGVTTKDPVEALQQVAVKLNTYADGVNKVGIAVALFGKQGGQFVATLKDIAELQDVGATVTARQAAEAEALAKEWGRLQVEGRGFANVVLNDIVPALRTVIDLFNTGAKASGSFGEGLNAFFSVGLRPGAVADQLDGVRESLARLKQEAKDGKFELIPGLRDHTIVSLEQQEAVILRARQLRARANATFSADDVNPRDIILGRKPEAPSISSGKEAAAAKQRISDADRYAESLAKQLQGTLELSTEETALAEIYALRQDAQSGLNAEVEKTILDYARQIDAAKAFAKAQQEQARADQEAARIRERNSQMVTREIENAQRDAQALREQNDSISEQIIFLKGGQEALDQYTDAKLAKAVAELQDKEAMLINAGASQQLIDAIHEQTKALQERQRLTGNLKLAEKFKKEAKDLQDVKNLFSDALVNPLVDFVTGTKSAKEAFRSFTDDLTRQIARIAAQNIANALFGGNNSGGPDIFGTLAKLAGWVIGGGGTGIVPDGMSAGGGFSGGGFGEHFAMGGVSKGGLAMVGEHGPEIVRLPRGASVTPNHKMAGYGREVNVQMGDFVFNGPTTTASARQVRSAARDAVMSAVRDR